MISHQDLQTHFETNLPGSLDLLRQMVDINSFTANPQGVNELASLTADAFEPLGFQAEFIQSANPHYGKHLFLARPAAAGSPMIACISHLDTVFPPEEEIANQFHWRSEGDRIYGPGTIDIKGGTVMIYMVLDALRTFAPQVFESVNWLIGVDASEESLSDDFANQCLERLSLETRACLVFEGGALNGDIFPIVVARKGRATFRVQVEGRSAHAGNAHAQGANAILQMAHTVQKIAGLTDYKRDLTFNVGTIQGGSVVNRVPHYAEALVEMRVFSPEVFQEGVDQMLALDDTSDISSAYGYPCRVSVDQVSQLDPWPLNDGTEGLYQVWGKAAATLGKQLDTDHRGGLSDGNLTWQHFPTLDGLGPSGANGHCSERSPDGSKDQEYVLVSSFVPKAMLNTLAILDLVAGE